MTFVSKLAMAAVLTLGSTALGASPATAQKNDKKDQKAQGGPVLKVSPEFRKAVALAEPAVKAKDWATADTNLAAAEALAKNDDERYYAGYLRLQLELGRNNEDGQLKVISALMSNPKTAPETARLYRSVFNYQLGVRASKAKNHAEAISYMLKAREAGSTEVDVAIVLANSYAATGKNADAIAEVERAIEMTKAKTGKPPESWYQFAIPKVNATGDRAAMVSWLSRFITEYPTLKNWHWAVQVYRSTAPAGGNAKVEKIDVYRLMRATNALPNRGDYADYAYTVQQGGLPWEAVSVIDEGRKAGKIPAGDSDVARTYAGAQTQVKSEGSLDDLATQAAAAKDGKTAAQTGDAFLASGKQARAVELYDLALTKGGVNADEINLHRGIAYQQLGQKEQARTAFGAVKAGPLANLATLYQTSLDLPPLS
jgi:tetratricopeptide (TPR) repeat protein